MSYEFKNFGVEIPKLKRIEINGDRHYIIPSKPEVKPMVSVTTALSHAKQDSLIQWKKRVGDKEADRKMYVASTIGTAFHTCIENHLQSKPVTFEYPILKFLYHEIKPVLKRINNIYAIEQSFYSTILDAAGTADIVAEFDGCLSIIDTKTSEQIKKEEWIESYFIQCAVYAAMIYELTGVKVPQLVIMMAARDTETKVFKKKFDMSYLRKFSKYVKQYRLDKSA